MQKITTILTTTVFLSLIFGLGLLGLLSPDRDVSTAERRPLAQVPIVTGDTILSGKAMTDFGDYAVDQFPFRDSFRTLKALNHYEVYRQLDNNGVYLAQDHIGKLEFPLKENSLQWFTQRISRVWEMYLQDHERVWYAVVPDKNYYLAEANGYPTMDYDRLLTQVRDGLPAQIQEISLTDTLTLDDYYRTDTHWDSVRLEAPVQRLAQSMGFADRLTLEHQVKTLTDAFYGVYYGQAAMPVPPDRLQYIEDPAILAATVTDYDKNITGPVYYADYAKELDPYAYFLNGSSSLLVIENPLAQTDAELVLFRDSFGSALAPWLIGAYSKITVVDIRYLMPEILAQYVDFTRADVLFLYSTMIINNSEVLK